MTEPETRPTEARDSERSTGSPLDGIPVCCGGIAPSASQCSAACRIRYLVIGLLLLGGFALIYRNLKTFSEWITYGVLRLPRPSRAGAAIEFFIQEAPKVLMLLVVILFAIGVVRTFFSVACAQRFLSGKREPVGILMAALLGVVTPFCSCTAVPLFIGFAAAGVPLGVTFAFLVSAPMVNEVALGLLLVLFGWKVTLLYVGTGLAIAMMSGFVLGRLSTKKRVEQWVLSIRQPQEDASPRKQTWPGRIVAGIFTTREIVGRIWLVVVLGIAIGAVIHGYVPEQRFAAVMGRGSWWAVPAAVLIGIPMYANAGAVVPVVEALLGKGVALGTALSLMMSVTALSLPEAIILRRVLKLPLLLAFFGIVAGGILIVGYVFNFFL